MSGKIMTALHAVMEACGYVQKNGHNKFHGYKYASEADLLDKLRPAMVKHGLLLLPSGQKISGPDEHGNVNVEVSYTLAHKDGEAWPEKLIAFGCGNDKNKNGIGDKGLYKALTGANKYLLFKLFQIETGDDPEQDIHIEEKPEPKPQKSGFEMILKSIAAKKSAIEIGQLWSNPKVIDIIDTLSVDEKQKIEAAQKARLAELETPFGDDEK